MDTAALIVLISETLLIWGLLTAAQFPLRRGDHKIVRTAVFAIKAFLIPVSALLWISINWFLPYAFGSIACAVYIALIGDVLASLIEYVIRQIRADKDDGCGSRRIFDHRIGVPLGLTFCIVVLALGNVNAEMIVIDEHEWRADGLENEHTFAFASDLHAGDALTMDALRDFCRQVNGSDAEFLILGGDVTDELTSYEDMIETYSILSTIDVPVFFVYGNHDRQPGADFVGGRTYTDEQLTNAIVGAGITILADEFVKVADDLVILGREDISRGDERKDWSEMVNPYGGALIVADHQPFDKEQLGAEVSAIQLSGHTHAGQTWPMRLIYSLLGLPSYGEYDYPDTRLYVSPGVGGWSPSFRLEGHSGWELITLHP